MFVAFAGVPFTYSKCQWCLLHLQTCLLLVQSVSDVFCICRRAFYLTIVSVMGIGTISVALLDEFQKPEWRPFRAAMFAGNTHSTQSLSLSLTHTHTHTYTHIHTHLRTCTSDLNVRLCLICASLLRVACFYVWVVHGPSSATKFPSLQSEGP